MNKNEKLPSQEAKSYKNIGKRLTYTGGICSYEGLLFQKGEIVFSQGRDWPPWPATILKVTQTGVSQVKFFCCNSTCWTEPQDLISFTSENIESFQKRYRTSKEKDAPKILRAINAALHAKLRREADKDKKNKGRDKTARGFQFSNRNQNQQSNKDSQEKVQVTQNLIEVTQKEQETAVENEPQPLQTEVYVQGKILNLMYSYKMDQIDNSYDDLHLREDQIYKLLKGVSCQRALLESKPFEQQKRLFCKILSNLFDFLKKGQTPRPTPKQRQILLGLLKCKKFSTKKLIDHGFAATIIRFVLAYESSSLQLRRYCKIQYVALRVKSNVFAALLSGQWGDEISQLLSLYQRRSLQ